MLVHLDRGQFFRSSYGVSRYLNAVSRDMPLLSYQGSFTASTPWTLVALCRIVQAAEKFRSELVSSLRLTCKPASWIRFSPSASIIYIVGQSFPNVTESRTRDSSEKGNVISTIYQLSTVCTVPCLFGDIVSWHPAPASSVPLASSDSGCQDHFTYLGILDAFWEWINAREPTSSPLSKVYAKCS